VEKNSINNDHDYLCADYHFRISLFASGFSISDLNSPTGYVLAKDPATNATNSSRNNGISRDEELRQVRLRQQEIANERAKEAAKLRKEKEEAERERKNNVAKKKPPSGDGERLGTGSLNDNDNQAITKRKKKMDTTSNSSSSGGYNPMQPWTSHASGYRYVSFLCLRRIATWMRLLTLSRRPMDCRWFGYCI
jgi:hypothetical protein